MTASVPLGYLANLSLGLALIGLALLLALRARGAGRVLSVYLGLVGVNYTSGAIGYLQGLAGHSHAVSDLVGDATADLDPVAILAFALTATGRSARRWAWPAAIVSGSLLLMHLQIVPMPLIGISRIRVGEILVTYGATFALLASRLLAARAEEERDRFALLFVSFGVLCLPRLSYVYTDLGLVSGVAGRTTLGTLWLEGALAVGFAATWLLMRFAAREDAWPAARRALRSLGLLLVVLAMMWLLRFVPILNEPAFALLYSMRWFLFLGVLTSGVRWRPDLLGLPRDLAPGLRRGYVVLLVALGAACSASLVAATVDAPPVTAILSGLAVTGVGVSVIAALRHARLTPDEIAWRRASVYRAHLLLGAERAKLAAVRDQLGLAPEEARELETMTELERGAAASGPEPGALFLGRYQITRTVGVGAFGRAFEAIDQMDGACVVVKELRAEWHDDPEALGRFRREAEVLLRVQHPNLVRLRAVEPAPGGHVLVLDAVPGESLRARLARGPLSQREAARLGRDVLGALAALHALGICHRDVKPENIVLRPDGAAVLLDLGAASSEGKVATRAWGRTAPGTPRYMAPEQAAGATAGPQGDLYALAVVLRESLRDVPAEWGALLARATEENPAQRFASAGAFSDAIP